MSDCETTRLLVHGLIDGELDAANTLAAEAHIADCADCGALHEEMIKLRARLGAADLHFPAPPGLAGIDAHQGPYAQPSRLSAGGVDDFGDERFGRATAQSDDGGFDGLALAGGVGLPAMQMGVADGSKRKPQGRTGPM